MRSLSNIRRNLHEPLRVARWDELIHTDGVHGSVYVDPLLYEEEIRNIWFKTWVYIGHESEVSKRHDFVMKSLGPEPIIMTRDGQGVVRLLAQ